MAKQKITQIDIRDGKAHYFKINKEDSDTFLEYGMFIEKLIREKKPIPKRVFDKYMNCIVPVETEFQNTHKQLFEERLEKLRERFITKNYQFSYKKQGGRSYSLEGMLEGVLLAVLNRDFTDELSKDQFIEICYTYLLKYANELDSKRQKILTRNKLTTITAYMLILFGYIPNGKIKDKINAGERPTNGELFKSIWHLTEKIELKKRK